MGGASMMSDDRVFDGGSVRNATGKHTHEAQGRQPKDRLEKRLATVESLCRKRQYARAKHELNGLEASAGLHRTPRLYAQFLMLSADVDICLGNYSEAAQRAGEAFEILRKTDENRSIARVQRILGVALLSRGELDEARTWFEDLLSTCRRTGSVRDTLIPLNGLAQVHFCSGRWSQALESLEQGLKVSKNLGDSAWTCTFLLNLGTVHRKRGDWSTARKYLQSGIHLAGEIGDVLQTLQGELSLASLELLQRNSQAASGLLEKSRETAENQGYRRELCLSYEGLGKLALMEGQFAEAEKYYTKALQMAKETAPEGDLAIELMRHLGDLYVTVDKPRQALRYANLALQAATRFGDTFEVACSHRTRALAYQRLHHPRKAQQAFQLSVQLLEEQREKYERAMTLLEFGKFLRVTKDGGEAFHLLLQAETLFKSLPSKYWDGVAQLEMAKVRAGEGDLDGAVVYLDGAQKLFEEAREKKALGESARFREVVEKEMIESALQAVSDHSVPEGDLDELIERLVDQTEATRAFFVLGRGDELEVVSVRNMEQDEASRLFVSLNALKLRTPLFSTNIHAAETYAHVQKDGISSFMLLPLQSSEMRGALYLDKQGSFGHSDLISSLRFTQAFVLRMADIRQKELEEENRRLLREIQQRVYPEIVTRDKKMLGILDVVDKVKDDSSPVLIEGETGTGKELIARALHYKSRRRAKPFVVLDCGTPTDTLAESQFFGHKKGSFTDAREDKPGLFEAANGGSLFLDEVSNLSKDAQAKLLRVLEEGKVRRIGETRERKVNVRVIAASNRDLQKEVAEGRFRKDLYYRLKGIRIQLPPLRERKEDIPLLVHHFAAKFAREKKRKVVQTAESAMRVLMKYDWDGNVRELESEIERAVVLMEDGRITTDLFSPSVAKTAGSSKSYSLPELLKVLNENHWVKRKAARLLGIPESTLRKRLKAHGITRPSSVRDSGAHS